jgi:Tat protein secretion system quality control protein TatD with DNase activity
MYTAEKISKILDVSLNEFSELTKNNTDRLLSRDLNE